MITPGEIEAKIRSIIDELRRVGPGLQGLRSLGTGAGQAAPGDSTVPTARSVNTTAPLAGGGSLAADLTLSIPAAGVAADGYLTSANYLIFAAKVGPTRAIGTTGPLTGGGDLSANRTIAIPKATALVDGYLAAADFTGISPIGAIICWTTVTPPTGWISADGSSLARTGTYAALFAVIGTTFGTVDASHRSMARRRRPSHAIHGVAMELPSAFALGPSGAFGRLRQGMFV